MAIDISGEENLPVVRLRPNKGKAYLGGHPWVYAEEIVLDRRTKGLVPGTVVQLQDAKRINVGSVALNTGSGIAARELSRRSEAISDEWIFHRLKRAFELRERSFDRPYYRLCHAEGDGLPGVVIDRFDRAVVIQPNTAWAENNLTAIIDALDKLMSPEAILANRESRGRGQENLSSGREVLRGDFESAVEVHGPLVALFADLKEGQKTGVYFDQFLNHATIAPHCKGKTVLDVFSNNGGFGLSALAAGARELTAIDGSEPALAMLKKAAHSAGFAERTEVIRADAFDQMKVLNEAGKKFGAVICDPPAFAPKKSALEAGLRAYGRVTSFALPLIEEGGIFVLCSCSHAVSRDALKEIVSRSLHKQGRRATCFHSGGAGPDHPTHPALPDGGYLKMLAFILD